MGFKLAELFVQISANGVSNVNNQLETVHSSLLRIGGAAAALFGVGGSLFGIGQSIKLASDFEQTEVAFTTMLHSATLAKSTIADLFQFAATTPFEFPQVAAAGKQLLAYGFQQHEIMENLRMIGDIASGVGASLGDITYLFGTSLAQGRVMTRDLMQFANRGIPVIAALAQHFKVADAAVLDMAQDGKISFNDLSAAFRILTSEGGQYGGMMERQSQTLLGLYSTLKDNLTMTLKEIGDSIVKAFDLKDKTRSLIEYTAVFKPMMTEFISGVVRAIAFVGSWGKQFIQAAAGVMAFRLAINAVSMALRGAAAAQAVFNALSGPKGWAQLIAGAAAATAALAAVDTIFSKINMSANAAAVSMGNFGKTSEGQSITSMNEKQIDKKLADIKSRRAELLKEINYLREKSELYNSPELKKQHTAANLEHAKLGTDEAILEMRKQELAKSPQILSQAGSLPGALAKSSVARTAGDLLGAAMGALTGDKAKGGLRDFADGLKDTKKRFKESRDIVKRDRDAEEKYLDRVKKANELEGKAGGLTKEEAKRERNLAAKDLAQAWQKEDDKKPAGGARMGIQDLAGHIQDAIFRSFQDQKEKEDREKMVKALEAMNTDGVTIKDLDKVKLVVGA